MVLGSSREVLGAHTATKTVASLQNCQVVESSLAEDEVRSQARHSGTDNSDLLGLCSFDIHIMVVALFENSYTVEPWTVHINATGAVHGNGIVVVISLAPSHLLVLDLLRGTATKELPRLRPRGNAVIGVRSEE